MKNNKESDNSHGDQGMIRAFLAVRLPLDLAGNLNKKAQQQVGDHDDVRWTLPQQQHITLKFLGHCHQNQLNDLVGLLGNQLAHYCIFDSMTGRFTFFPSARTPRVLALEMHSGHELGRLARVCERAAVQCGFSPEHRRFRPHVTLGRFRVPQPAQLSRFFNLPSFRMTVAEVVLMKSELGKNGAPYQVLHSFPLQPQAISA